MRWNLAIFFFLLNPMHSLFIPGISRRKIIFYQILPQSFSMLQNNLDKLEDLDITDFSEIEDFDNDKIEKTEKKEKCTKNNIDDEPDTMIYFMENRIQFYGPITHKSCMQLLILLSEIENNFIEFPYKFVELHIQSTGGELLPTFHIADYIKQMKCPVHTYIDSYAASAATILSVVGTKRYMSEHSLILIHQLSTQIAGKYGQMENELTNLKTIMELAENIYLENSSSKLEPDQLKKLLEKDIWLNASLALEYGLVDEIY
tara:strand:- start:1200 stop:1979 length:780 start_codon:yes stop_codon:yes gene_type:complete